MTEWTPDGLRTVPHIWAVSPEMDDLEELIAPYATAWEDARRRAEERYAQLERDFDIMRHAKQSRIETLEQWGERASQVLVYAATVARPGMDEDTARLVDKTCMDLDLEWAALRGEEEKP
jgi:hypothetical protein